MPKYRDLRNESFGRLKALRYVGTKHDCALWLCLCYCGNLREATSGELRRKDGPLRTCGRCYDHKKYPTEYIAWRNMLNRCYDTKGEDYKNYGARGIEVCMRWRADFLHFLSDLGFKPQGDFSLDRINNDLGYSPENCKWATRYEQNNNKRNVTNSVFELINRR